jgi:hypothetical protein
VDFWGATLNAMQANAQAVTQINAKMIDSWISFLKKNAVELSEAAPSKA